MGLNIHLEFDADAMAAPAAFRTAIQQAASMLDAAIANPITVNIEIEYGEEGVDALTGFGETNVNGGDYSTVRADLIANAARGDTTFNALPATSPWNNGVTLSYAEEKLFGILPANASGLDGVADFGTGISKDEIVPAALDILTRVLGRNPSSANGSAGSGSLFDLFRFTSQGVRMGFTPNPSQEQLPASYFSVDNGVTNLANYDRLGGYALQASGDPFSGTGPGEVQHLTNLDLEQLDALGFDTVLPRRRPPSDFNGDHQSDVLWRNTSGDTTIWNSNGSGGFVGQDLGIIDNSWQVARTGDFNGDGKADILWRNTSGEAAIWNSNGSGGFTSQDLGNLGASWQAAGTGDFNGDGKADILWRNTSGEAAIWQSNGSGGYTAQDLGNLGTDWQVAGVGDFNGDGKADVLWRNASGEAAIWNSNGAGGFAAQDLGNLGNSWQVAGTGDFNGDGKADILWSNANGDTAIWNSSGANSFTGQDLATAGSGWQVAGIGDYNGDGKSDILWRSASGDTAIWDSNGSGGFIGHDLGTITGGWSVQRA
jgi:hypothetical protein